jgi:hypothetical protein
MQHNDPYQPPILNEGEAAQFLRVSIRSLQSWRVSGSGPAFLKIGRAVRYDRGTLTQWLSSRARASTAAHTVAG